MTSRNKGVAGEWLSERAIRTCVPGKVEGKKINILILYNKKANQYMKTANTLRKYSFP